MADVEGTAAGISGRQWACDDRGAVYVEFLFAFLPLFVLVLSVCQLALIASAKAIVEHAAWAAARSAVVVLEDDPAGFGGVARGDSVSPSAAQVSGIGEVLVAICLSVDESSLGYVRPSNTLFDYLRGTVETSLWPADSGGASERARARRSSRMKPIRAAAYVPLLPLADTAERNRSPTIQAAIDEQLFMKLRTALAYVQAAAAVTLHASVDDETVKSTPFAPGDDVTARVVFLFPCKVPVARQLLCSSYAALLERHDQPAVSALNEAESAPDLDELLSPDGRYTVLTGRVTLVNQGARYEER